MKIVAISDTHGLLMKNIPECDVLCIAGDISPLKAQRNMPQMISWLRKRFITWAEEIPAEKIILVAGNHDFVFETITEENNWRYEAIQSLNILSDKIKYLEDSSFTYKGKVFYGSPWVVGPANWAFYDPTKKLDIIKQTMPMGVDVAIFHQPLEFGGNGRVLQVPSWMIGATFPTEQLKDPNFLHPSYGSTALDDIVEQKRPKLVLTGHVHSGNHELISFGDNTMVANVSILDEDYKQRYQPFEMTL